MISFESHHGQNENSEELPLTVVRIGFVGYDLIGLYENIGFIPEDTIGTIQIFTFSYMRACDFDHKKEKRSMVEENPIVDGGSRASVELGASISTIGKTLQKEGVSGQGLRCASFPQSFGAKRL